MKHEGLNNKFSVLLELSASNDLRGFKEAIEQEGHNVGEVGLWYGRRIGSKKIGYEERTPLLIAALFGSKDVLNYILETGCVDLNRTCGSDGANALHCAVSGGSNASPEVVKLLLDASADASAVDANGNRPIDLIVTLPNSVFNSRKRSLQAILEGTDVFDEAYLLSEEAIAQAEEQRHQEITTPRFSKDGNEKKDYPIDLSLPDIKNGIYGTDEFRMYTFKVKPCSRAYSHDWTECPFVHPGENARRRDPRKYHYSCVPCPEFRKGSCSKGDACEYAHGIFECWLHPAQYRTRLCKDEDTCTRRVCFFAHKAEELRPLYASTGSAMPSPRSFSAGASSFEMGSMCPLTLGSPSVLIPAVSTPPLTPTGASSTGAGGMWPPAQCNGAVPTLQLPRSRLQTTLAARDIDLDMELVEHENHRHIQQLMMESLSSPSSWNNAVSNNSPFPISLGEHAGEVNHLGGLQPTNLEDIFGSLEPTILPKVQGISLDAGGSQLQPPTGIQARQNGNQQLRNYSSGISNSNMVGSPSFGVDSKGLAASVAFNSRAAAFSKRSQSFIERGLVNRHSELCSPAAASSAMSPSNTSDWGSPNGKLDWSIQGDELNKLRKSASFGFRGSHCPSTKTTARLPANSDEPDISWVNSLVKDNPPLESGQFSSEEPQQCHNKGTDTGSTWLDQYYMEHEQIVA